MQNKLHELIFKNCKLIVEHYVLVSSVDSIFLCFYRDIINNHITTWLLYKEAGMFNDICFCYRLNSIFEQRSFKFYSPTLTKEEVFKFLPDTLKQVVLFNMDEFEEVF